jgi:Mg2+ and Co2+ transporter CorA
MTNKRRRYVLVIFAVALALIMIAVYAYFTTFKPPIYDPVHKP